MPDAFFQKKRKRTEGTRVNGAAQSKRGAQDGGRARGGERGKGGSVKGKARSRDEAEANESDIESDDDIVDRTAGKEADDFEEIKETPAQARVRLAKAYLDGLKADQQAERDDFAIGADAAEIDRENIASRLQRDVDEQSGRMHVFLSPWLSRPSTSAAATEGASADVLPLELAHRVFGVRGHKNSVTATALTPDCRHLYTASKGGEIIKWSVKDGCMVHILPKCSKAAKASVTPKETKTEQSKRSGAARRKAMRAAKARGKCKATGQEDAMHLDADNSSHLHISLQPGQGHTDEILALAISPDGKYLVSGGRDRMIGVWSIPTSNSASASSETWVRGLRGHKDAITALRFRQARDSPYELYSASLDRTIKLWAVDQLSYIETLFGHQDPVLGMDMLRDETAISAGGRDRTVRYWKVRNESQLVFRGGGLGKANAGSAGKLGRELLEGGELDDGIGADGTKFKFGPIPSGVPGSSIVTGRDFFEGSIDCVAMVDESHFLSGGDSGSIALWSVSKKKPIFTRVMAHGYEDFEVKSNEGIVERVLHQPRWITSITCLPYGDLFASGSWDGHIRLWTLDKDLKGFKKLYTIPAAGFVNSLQLITPPVPKKSKKQGESKLTTLSECIAPELWRRCGGLVDITSAASATDSLTNGHANTLANGHAPPSVDEADDPHSGEHQVRIAKERVSPLLIIGMGKEPRLGRWKTFGGRSNRHAAAPEAEDDRMEEDNDVQQHSAPARNGTIIVSLPMKA